VQDIDRFVRFAAENYQEDFDNIKINIASKLLDDKDGFIL
jgi:hypothetical protein